MLIDFHTHIFPDSIAARTVATLADSSSIPSHSDGTQAGLVAAMERAGVALSINLPVLTSPRQLSGVRRFALTLNEAYRAGTGRILSFAGVHPACEDIEETVAALAADGFLGIKIHPDYQGTYIDDEAYVRLLSCAKAHGLITVTHAGVDGGFVGCPVRCTPTRVLRLLDRLGGYDRLVLAHLGGNELHDEVLRTLAGENVYLDTAYSLHHLSHRQMHALVERHGADRILFATDSPWRDVAEEVALLRDFSLGEDAERRIFSENAKTLIGM